MARQTNINVNVNSTSAVKSINVLKKAFVDLNNTIKQTTNNGKIKLDIDLGGIDLKLLNDIAKSLNKINKSMVNLNNSAGQFSQAGRIFNVTSNTIIRNTNNVSRSVSGLSNQMVASVVAFESWKRGLSSLMTSYRELSASTFGIAVADQMTLSQIDKLNESFLSLSTTVPHSASSLAQAVDDLIRTGRSYEESRKIIEQVAKLSTASGDNLKDTAQVVTKVMTALDINANKTVETLNSMHSTAIRTASDMGYLAEAFKNVAGTASVLVKSSGLSGDALDDYKQDVLDLTNSITGSFANLGLSASQAGTKTKVFYSKLVAMEKTAKNLFDQAMRLNDIRIGGEVFDSTKLSELAKTDLKSAVQLISELYTQGKLSSQVLQKMFTGRHFLDIGEILVQINGDVNSFVDGIAKGVNYASDFYKKMFDSNEQIKQLSINIESMLQKETDIGKSLTGLIMAINDSLKQDTKEVEKNTDGILKNIAGMSLSAGTVSLGFGTLLHVLKTIGGALKGSLFNPVTAFVGAIGASLYIGGKYLYNLNKDFADTSIILDNINLKTSDVSKNLRETQGYVSKVKLALEDSSSQDLINEHSLEVLELLTKDMTEFKQVMTEVSKIEYVNFEKIQTDLSSVNKEYNKLLDDLYSKKSQLESELSKDLSALAFKSVGSKGTFKQASDLKYILDTYIQLKKEGKDVEEINNTIFGLGKQLGVTSHSIKNAIKEINTETIKNNLKETLELENKSLELSQQVHKSFEGTYERISKNQEIYSNLIALATQTDFEIFKKTGEFKGLTGIDAFKELYDSSKLQVYTNQISELEIEIKKANTELENMYLAQKRNDKSITEDTISKQKSKIAEYTETHKSLLEEQETQKELLKQINLEEFKNIEINDKNYKNIFRIIDITSKLNEESEKQKKNLPYDQNLIDFYNHWLSQEKFLLKILNDEQIAQQNKTKYQIKYVNYLKENLNVELERSKIGKTIGEQETLIYSYKLKQLEIDKKVADKEASVAKNTISNLQIEENLRKKLLSIKTAKQGQDFIDTFYESHKNILTGKLGERDKNIYEAVKVYTNALSKSENLLNKLDLEPLKVVREFIDNVPSSISNSISALSELANQGLIPFNEYEKQILEQSENTLKEYKDKVWKQYNLGSLELAEAISNNMSNIDYVKGLENKSSEIEEYFKNLKTKVEKDDKLSKIYIELDTDESTTIQEKLAFIMKVLLGEQKDLLEVQNKSLETRKKELDVMEKQVKLLSGAGNLISSFGDIFQMESISNIGEAIKNFGNFEKEMQDVHIDWEQVFKGKDLKANFTEIFEGAFKGINLGNIVGTAVGGITGGGIASQQGGALAGLITGALGMTGWGALATVVGGSLIGGLFDSGDDKAEAEKRTKESNKLYNKNTEALQKLAQNMSNLSGGVDSLNNTLISAVSKTPTIDNINGVTDAMTNMYKTMEKTRKFNDVAYQVTKTKKKKGFLGIGGGSTSWTETIEISVNEMLRRYGFKGALEDMTSQQIRDFSTWLDNYDLGDSDNFSILADALEDYAEGLDKFDKNIQNFFRDTTMEAFSGISSLEQESLRQQIEDFYKNLGFQIDEETSKQIDKLAEEMSVMVTIMSDVRNEFLNQWRETGQSAGSVFLSSMKPYIDAMLGNISQIYYDVYFSGVNENLEKEFKNLSEQLVELKKQGKDLDWSSVTDKLSSSFGNVLNSILATKNETASFNEILMELQKQALESGLSLSEIFDLGLLSGTQKDVMEAFKESLTSSDSENTLNSIGEMLGDKIGETMVNKMLDNLLSDRVLEFSAQIDKVMSGNLNFDSLAELSNQALSVGLMMSAEADRLSAIKELFNFKSDIEYTTQNENIEYSSGVSQNVTNIYNLSSSVEAGAVIESDNIERLAEELLDVMLEKLRVDKGINLK